MEQDTASGRTIAIGDIHGCCDALRRVIQEVDPQPADTIVTLGDYIDRGPDSRGVVDFLLQLRERCNLVHLLGNHELMLLIAKDHPSEQAWWESVGGAATVQSYRGGEQVAEVAERDEDTGQAEERPPVAAENEPRQDLLELVPQEHIDFFESSPLAYETDTHIFVHANYEARHPICDQTEEVLLWKHLYSNQIPQPHISGKQVVVGHTPQFSGDVLDLGHVICIDTYCFGHGWLTALDVDTKQVWQACKRGELRCTS